MTDIIKEIYLGNYLPAPKPQSPPDSALVERTVSLLGPDGFDELVSQLCGALRDEDIESFRAGFRLGASLMLELL